MSKAASFSRCNSGWHDAAGVEGLVVTFILLSLMEGPVFIEVMNGAHSSELQNGFSARKTPSGTADFHFAPAGGGPARPHESGFPPSGLLAGAQRA